MTVQGSPLDFALKNQQSDYGGHDRDEVTRIIMQAINDLGYPSVAQLLHEESGLSYEAAPVSLFRTAVLTGDWDQAEKLLLQTLELEANSDREYLSFLIRRQQYLELLESQQTQEALHILRTKLSVLPYDSDIIGMEEAKRRRNEIHQLTNLLMVNPKELIGSLLAWDGAKGNSRALLLEALQELISTDMMIPKYRLAKLLDQARQFQLSGEAK